MNYLKEETLIQEGLDVKNYLPDLGIEKVKDEIIAGLKYSTKYISSKYFYDKIGSELFEEITKLDEYYPTRIEKKILSTIVNNLNIDFNSINIIELGSGDVSKIRLLLQQLSFNELSSIKYFPVDISQSAIEGSIKNLLLEFPTITTSGIVADFMHQLNVIPREGKRLFCFFGSTIGNLTPLETKEFMTLLGGEMQKGDSLLMGMDMVKDISVIEKAYNDSKNVTAQFNKNILNVVNSLIGSDFNVDNFNHIAFYNRELNRIEMHLEAKKDMVILLNSDANVFLIKKGETIHTENSHKFNYDSIKDIGNSAGLNVQKIVEDDEKWFSLVHYVKH